MLSAFSRWLPQISLTLAGLMFVLPFLQFHHNYPLPGFYGEWLAALLGLLALTLLLQQRWWREAFALPLVALLPLGLFAVLLLQLALSMAAYPQQILLAALYLLWALLLTLLGYLLRREFGWPALAQTLAWFLLAGGALNALFGILQHYQLHTVFDPVVSMKMAQSVYGNLAQPNHYADYLGLALVSALLLHARGRLPLAWAVPLFGLLLFVMALSGSRSSWLYLAAMLAWAWGWRRRRRDAASKKTLLAVVGLLLAYAVAQWLAQLPALLPADSSATTAAQRLFAAAEDPSGSIRFYLWREAWRMFLQAPLLGQGWGQFPWQHFTRLEVMAGYEVQGWFTHAHNILLHLLAETGLAGTLPLLAGIALWLYHRRRIGWDAEQWWLLAMLSVLVIHSLLEAPLWYAYFLGIAAFLLGAGETRTIRLDLRRLGRIAVAVMLIFGGAALINLGQHYRSLERLLFTRYDSASTPASFAETQAELMHIHRDSLLTPYIELAYSGTITLDAENLREKLELNTRAMHFAPVADVAFRQALLLALAGDQQAARRELARAALAYPGQLPEVAAKLRQLVEKEPAKFGGLLELVQQKERNRAVRTK